MSKVIKKSNNMSSYLITIIVLIIIIICAIIGLLIKNNYFIEKYEDYSPYPNICGNQLDKMRLRRTLRQWEKPFNTHNEGYYNAEPRGLPPLVPLYAFTEMKNVLFPENNSYS
jgi:hypothetical protein